MTSVSSGEDDPAVKSGACALLLEHIWGFEACNRGKNCSIFKVVIIDVWVKKNSIYMWTFALSFTQINKFLPPYLRKKLLDEQPPTIPAFQVIPNSGSLDPDERLNVQIKFIPTVEVRRLAEFGIQKKKQDFQMYWGIGPVLVTPSGQSVKYMAVDVSAGWLQQEDHHQCKREQQRRHH